MPAWLRVSMPRGLSKASAKMLRDELWVHKKRTFRTCCSEVITSFLSAARGFGGCRTAAAGGCSRFGRTARCGGRGRWRTTRRGLRGLVEHGNVGQGVKVLPGHALRIGDPVLFTAGIA